MLPVKQLFNLVILLYSFTTTTTHTNINIANENCVILQNKDLHYVSCSL